MNRLFQDAKSTLEDEAIKLTKQAEANFKKELSAQQKKLSTIERDYQNKVKIITSKLRNNTNNLNGMNASMRSANMSTMLKSSKGAEDPLAASKKSNDKLKARVLNLEKSYEIMKTK